MRGINIVLLVYFFVAFPKINAQKSNSIDSLKNKFINCNSDTQKVNLLINLYYKYSHVDADSSNMYALKALKYATLTKNDKFLAIANFITGISYMTIGDTKKNINHQFISLKYSEALNDKSLILKNYNSIANCYASQRNFDIALIYYKKANSISEEINDKNISVILMNIGNIYYEKGYKENDFTKAYKYYLESLKFAKQEKNADQISAVLSNLSLTYCDDKKYKEALKCLTEALVLSDSLGFEENKISIYYLLGRVKTGLKLYDEGLLYFNKSLALAVNMNDKDYISENYISIAELNSDLGNYKLAYEFHKKYKAAEDSLITVSSLRELNELQTKYETTKKQKENELLTTQNKLSTQTIKQQKITSYFIIAGLILALGLAYFIFRGLKNQRNANKVISMQKQEVEKQKIIVEEHQKEILASIHYAKRIQNAMLPQEKFIERKIKQLNK